MKYNISKFTWWLLRRIFRKAVRQSHLHEWHIKMIYSILYDECHREFREDNMPTLDSFLRECFEDSMASAGHVSFKYGDNHSEFMKKVSKRFGFWKMKREHANLEIMINTGRLHTQHDVQRLKRLQNEIVAFSD